MVSKRRCQKVTCCFKGTPPGGPFLGSKTSNPWEPHVLYVKYADFFGAGCLEGTRPEGSGSIFEPIFVFLGVIFV